LGDQAKWFNLSLTTSFAVTTASISDLLNLCGSPVHLSKAVMNLVTNAAEAMPEGGTVCISTRNIKKVMGRSGTGLGMVVVWGTVQDHNGHIALSSEKYKGTEISLYFPANRCELTVEKAPDPIETFQGHGETILVVDDQHMQREVLGAMPTRLGYSVEVVESGEDAVAYTLPIRLIC
jgi:two-component system, cell cycle sensor histidine kinase and response regulator CckA